MSAPGLTDITERFGMAASAVAPLTILVEMLARDDRAPTTVREIPEILDDHLADSLVALEIEFVRSARRILDVGSGAGLPGLPLALALPEAQVTLIDASSRKCEFMRGAAAAMGLDNVSVRHARAEELTDALGSFDVVTARALAPLDVVAEYASPLLEIGGHLVAWRGQREPEVEAEGATAAEKLGLSVLSPVHVHPYPAAKHRYLHLMSKVTETPKGFPRRVGMARKRPLGAR